MKIRLIAATLVLWWIATPSVCGAFLSTASCGPAAAQPAAGLDAANEMPCHGGDSLPTSTPLENDEGSSCCGGVDLSVSAKPVIDAPIDSMQPLAQSVLAFTSLRARPDSALRTPDRLRSPYTQVSPPLLN
jgi:hypothetical protein